MNVSAIAGPTLGGLLLPVLGAPAVFGLNAACSLLMIVALRHWLCRDADHAAELFRALQEKRSYPREKAALIVRLLWRTREDPRVDLGASPRSGLLLLRAAKAYAMMQGRDHALPDDVQALAETVLSHRLVLAPESPRRAAADVVTDAVSSVRAL